MLMIDISIALDIQAAYVRFNLGEYGRWIEVDEDTNVDLGSDGRVLGVEFLYFGNLTASRESLNLKKPDLSEVVIDAVLEAQEILVKKLS